MRYLTDPNALYERILAENPQVIIDDQIYWLVESDVMIDRDHLGSYAIEKAEEAQQRQQGLPVEEQRLLAIASTNGRIVRWRKGKVLTYSVNYATFNGNNTEYQQVITAMNTATRDWEAVCAIKFHHLVEFDKSNPIGLEPPLFDVRRANQNPTLLAWAFFPSSPKAERHIWIETAFFHSQTNPFSMEGVLRHELGHVLGFRHEHIREGAPISCEEVYHSLQVGDTTANTVPLTPYDRTSVMHYLCPGMTTNNPKLHISAKDQEGAQAVYGTPDGKLVPPDHLMDYRD